MARPSFTLSLGEVKTFETKVRPRTRINEQYELTNKTTASAEFEGDSSRLRIFDILYRVYPNVVHNLDSKGRTALHLASRNVLFDLVVRLGKVGVNVNAKDHEGMTALDHLRSRRASQKFEPRYLLLRRNFEKEMDEIEGWLLEKLHETS
jgi:hypothetical protein